MQRGPVRRFVSTDNFPLIVLMILAVVAIVVTVSVAFASGRFDRERPADDPGQTATTRG